jgi:hypothetical protein
MDKKKKNNKGRRQVIWVKKKTTYLELESLEKVEFCMFATT